MEARTKLTFCPLKWLIVNWNCSLSQMHASSYVGILNHFFFLSYVASVWYQSYQIKIHINLLYEALIKQTIYIPLQLDLTFQWYKRILGAVHIWCQPKLGVSPNQKLANPPAPLSGKFRKWLTPPPPLVKNHILFNAL